jgi:hypothetical protein
VFLAVAGEKKEKRRRGFIQNKLENREEEKRERNAGGSQKCSRN